MARPLKSKNQLSPESSDRAVKEFAEAWAVQVVLYVPRIGVIEQVEDAQSDFHLPLLGKGEPELSVCLKIEGVEVAKAVIVSGADEITSFVHNGVRKSGVNVENGHDCHPPRRIELSPRQEAVRGIEV